MAKNTYIAYLGAMNWGGTTDWTEKISAASPDEGLHEAVKRLLDATGRTPYPEEFGVNLAKASRPERVIASVEFDAWHGATYDQRTSNSTVHLKGWEQIVTYVQEVTA